MKTIKEENITITKKQLKQLWFWANVGVKMSVDGSSKGIIDTLPLLKKLYKLYGLAPTARFMTEEEWRNQQFAQKRRWNPPQAGPDHVSFRSIEDEKRI